MNSQKGEVGWEYKEKKAGVVPSFSPNPRQTQVRACHMKSDPKGQRKQLPRGCPGWAGGGLETDPPWACLWPPADVLGGFLNLRHPCLSSSRAGRRLSSARCPVNPLEGERTQPCRCGSAPEPVAEMSQGSQAAQPGASSQLLPASKPNICAATGMFASTLSSR